MSEYDKIAREAIYGVANSDWRSFFEVGQDEPIIAAISSALRSAVEAVESENAKLRAFLAPFEVAIAQLEQERAQIKANWPSEAADRYPIRPADDHVLLMPLEAKWFYEVRAAMRPCIPVGVEMAAKELYGDYAVQRGEHEAS